MQKIIRSIVIGAMVVVVVLGIPLIFPSQARAETDQSGHDRAAEELNA
jgi:hypothetical protein